MEDAERGEAPKCKPSVQADLLNALKRNDKETFLRILPNAIPDHFYRARDLGTCLYIAAERGQVEFAEALIDAGSNPNLYNPKRKKTPLHAASEEGHPQMVQLLLDRGGDINSLDDSGRLPLHSAADGSTDEGKDYTGDHLECLRIFLDAGSPIDVKDRAGDTALRLSVIRNHEKAAKFLLQQGANPDVDSNCGKSIRCLIQEKMPALLHDLRPLGAYGQPQESDIKMLLFSALHKKNLRKFQDLLKEASVDILSQMNDGKHTLLQYACENNGHEEFVAALLQNPAVDPNCTCPGEPWKPILLAAYQGNSNALDLLVAHKKTDICVVDDRRFETALHKVARMEKSSSTEHGYLDCLKILTKAIQGINSQTPSNKRINVNAVDALGNTALHYAAQNLDGGGRQVEDMVALLLRAGSYVGIRNKMGEPAISRVLPSIIEDYLNDCVGTNGEAPCEEGYELTFDYTMIVPPSVSFNDCTDVTDYIDDFCPPVQETEPLMYICNSKEHQRLLKHPIITSFLFLKWHRIRFIFYGNLAFYSVFVAFLTAYILGIYGMDPPPEDAKDSSSFKWTDGCFGINVVLLFILIIRELFQFMMSPLKYMKSLENILEVLLITVTLFMLFSSFEMHIKQHLAAISILLLWIELVLLVGRHPNLSTYITMFTTVSCNFLTFLMWYSLLIVAFALSFFVLFRKGDPSDDAPGNAEEEEKNPFADPGRAVLKTAVMLTGEFDFGDLPLDAFRITSHLVFLLFLFLIAVVLLNLLNGLAVSDTQAVQDKAELVGYQSRVALVSHVESMMLGKPLQLLNRLRRCFGGSHISHRKVAVNDGCLNEPRRGLGEKVLVFPELKSIQILVNRGGRIEPRCCSKKNACNHWCAMDRKVIQAARNIVARRKQRTEMDEVRQRLNNIEDLLKQLVKAPLTTPGIKA